MSIKIENRDPDPQQNFHISSKIALILLVYDTMIRMRIPIKNRKHTSD
jgi:hypothetical protein